MQIKFIIYQPKSDLLFLKIPVVNNVRASTSTVRGMLGLHAESACKRIPLARADCKVLPLVNIILFKRLQVLILVLKNV